MGKSAKRFAVCWISFVYVYFAWNVIPFIYKEYLSRFAVTIQRKLSSENSRFSIKIGESQSSSNLFVHAIQIEKSNQVIQSQTDYAGRKRPHVGESFANLVLNIIRTVLLLWILLIAYAWGKKIISWVEIAELNRHFELLIAFGLGCIAYFVLFSGVISLLGRNWVIVFLLGLFLVSLKESQEAFIKVRQLLFEWIRKKSSFEFPIVLSLLLFILLFLGCFIPDQFYDTLTYHLALPQTYLNFGEILSLPYNMHFSFPQTAEMLFTLGLAISGNDVLPLLLQLSFGILIFLSIISWTEQNSILAALVWLSCPIVMENLRFAKSDIFFSLMVSLIFFLFSRWEQQKEFSWISLAGIFSGFMIGTKYTGFSFMLFFAILIFLGTASSGWKICLKTSLVYFFSAFLVASPWLIKNYFCFQNPLYPFLQEFFGYHYMRAENWQAFLNENHQFYGLGAQWDWGHPLRVLWMQTFYGYEFASMNFIGPIWLAFSPLIFIVKSSTRIQKWAKIFLFICYITSTTQTTLARYFLLPVLPIAAFLVVSLIEQSGQIIFRRLLIVGLILQLFGWLPLLERVSYGRRAIFGLSEEKERKLYPSGYYDAFQWVNFNLPSDSLILFVGETKFHRFERKVIAPYVHNEHLLSKLARESISSEQLYEKLKKLKVTHLLLNPAELERTKGYPMFDFSLHSLKILQDFWKTCLLKVYSGEILIYEIKKNSDAFLDFPFAHLNRSQ